MICGLPSPIMSQHKQNKLKVANKEALAQREQEVSLEQYSGPIPHADLLEKYEKVHSGLADRIMKMAESQTQHRQQLESRVITGDIIKSFAGLIFAFLIAALGIIGGIYLILKDKPTSGYVTIFAPLGLIAGAFILTKREEQEQENKKETDTES